MRKYLVLALAGIVAASIAACHHGADGITGGGGGGGTLHLDLTAIPNTIPVGGTVDLTAIVRDANGTAVNRQVSSFTSSSTTVATVTNGGRVTGVAPGQVTITASTSDPLTATVQITVVTQSVNSIILSPSTLDMRIGDTQQITATLKASDGTVLTGRTVTWASDNTGAATVDASGVVTAHGAGGAVITATSEGKTATATVSVTNTPVETVTVNGSPSMYLAFNQVLTATTKDAAGNVLSGRTVTWSTSDANKVTIDASGNAHAAGIGAATISATSEGKVGSINITVTAAPVASVTVTPANPSILVGGTATLTATTKDANGNVLTGRAVSWSTNNAPVATVASGTGVVNGQSAGSATITATSEGVTGNTVVTVGNVPIDHITITVGASSIIAPNTTTTTATAFDVSNHVLIGRAITFASSNTAAATINSSTGVITGVGAGTTNITASGEGKTSNAVPLTVLAGAATVTVTCTSGSTVVGQPGVTCTAVVKDAGGNVLTGRAVTFASSNGSVATIDASGNVTFVGTGSANITASVEGKTSAPFAISVALAPVSTITVTPTTKTLSVGQTQALTVVVKDQWGNVLTGRTITASGNTNPAAVSVSGGAGGVFTATAVATAAGCATTTSTLNFTSEGKTTSPGSTITVQAAVNTVEVSPSAATVYISGDLQLVVTLRDVCGNVIPNAAHVISYSTADGSKASVSGAGLVHGVQSTEALSPSYVNITVTSEGKSFVVPVTVRAPVAVLLISPLSANLSVSSSTPYVDLFVTLKDANGATIDNTTRVITYTLSAPGIVTVAATGSASPYFRVTAVGAGDVTVTVTAEGVSNTMTVHVIP